MSNRKNTTIFILGFIAAFSILTALVLADSDEPYGVRTINEIQSSRPNVSAYIPANLTNVAAGNVTEITLYGISTTKAWAGYYGNITGTITLEDAAGYVFYNWTALEPKGEIYASINDTISWADISCFEFDGSAGNFDVDDAEGWFDSRPGNTGGL